MFFDAKWLQIRAKTPPKINEKTQKSSKTLKLIILVGFELRECENKIRDVVFMVIHIIHKVEVDINHEVTPPPTDSRAFRSRYVGFKGHTWVLTFS